MEAGLPREFFQRSPLVCARALLGCRLRWENLEARIVETEAYEAVGDPACHTFRRPSARAFVAGHPPGTAYVYLNYGVHWLFNVLVKSSNRTGFVLIRAVEPPQPVASPNNPQTSVAKSPCNGPGKLTKVLGIHGGHHQMDLCSFEQNSFLPRLKRPGKICRSPRIGISLGQGLLWRFYLADNPHVSGTKSNMEQPRKRPPTPVETAEAVPLRSNRTRRV